MWGWEADRPAGGVDLYIPDTGIIRENFLMKREFPRGGREIESESSRDCAVASFGMRIDSA
jgi:hypothetical protein